MRPIYIWGWMNPTFLSINMLQCIYLFYYWVVSKLNYFSLSSPKKREVCLLTLHLEMFSLGAGVQARESEMGEEGRPIYGCVIKLTTTTVSWNSVLPVSSKGPAEMHFRTVHRKCRRWKHFFIVSSLLPPIGGG